jgi:hypothetical protein
LFVGRSGKQCRERYHNNLNPSLFKKVFTSEDDKKLNELQQQMGSKWNLISCFFDGCSQRTVKNRWYLINRCKTNSVPKSLNFISPISSEQRSLHNDEIIVLAVDSPTGIESFPESEIDTQKVMQRDKLSALLTTSSLVNIRSAYNFHRQDQCYKHRDPFIIPPSNWAPVILRLGPEYIPIFKFCNNERIFIWPTQTTTILTVDNIGFGLLWSILSEEFGWTHIHGKGCVNDLFKSPIQITQNNAHKYNFSGSAHDLRRHVKLYGLSGSHTLLMTTLFGFALSDDVEGYKWTTLTIFETPLKQVLPTNTFVYNNECSVGFNCFCCGDPSRIGDGATNEIDSC